MKQLEAQLSSKGAGVPLFRCIMLPGLPPSPPTCQACPLSAERSWTVVSPQALRFGGGRGRRQALTASAVRASGLDVSVPWKWSFPPQRLNPF